MRLHFAIVLLGLVSVAVAENLPVIAVNGATTPVVPYIQAAHFPVMNTDITSVSPELLQHAAIEPDHFSLEAPLPKTDMTPGIEIKRNVNLSWLATPIFLIGSDEQSLQWLKQHQADLVSLHAQGLLVNAQSSSDINQIRSSFSDLSIMSLSANMIADRLAIKHYPVLITSTEIKK
jgi:integrating conjugative element protein (TIGR03765 family)